jgi:acylphosphatase
MKRRLIVKVEGRVQGVFFRANTQKVAQNLNLTGWVLNESDGSVMVLAEGEEKNLRELLDFLKTGPNHAIVEKVQIKWAKATDEFDNFEVRYE